MTSFQNSEPSPYSPHQKIFHYIEPAWAAWKPFLHSHVLNFFWCDCISCTWVFELNCTSLSNIVFIIHWPGLWGILRCLSSTICTHTATAVSFFLAVFCSKDREALSLRLRWYWYISSVCCWAKYWYQIWDFVKDHWWREISLFNYVKGGYWVKMARPNETYEDNLFRPSVPHVFNALKEYVARYPIPTSFLEHLQ